MLLYIIINQTIFLMTLIPRFGSLELQNQVMQNDVIIQVTNSKVSMEILFLSYYFDFIKYRISLRVTNSKV